MSDLLRYVVEFGAIAAIMAVCVATGFGIYRSYELIRAERVVTSSDNPKLASLLARLAAERADSEDTMDELEKELMFVQSTIQRRELIGALTQPTDRGRRAYIAKLSGSIKATEPPKQMASGGGSSFF